MDIAHTFDGAKGSFFIELEGERIAEMTYVMSGNNLMIIDHTSVSPSLKGQGVGAKLVLAGVEHARTNHLKVVPLCPFAKKEFERHDSFSDVVAK